MLFAALFVLGVGWFGGPVEVSDTRFLMNTSVTVKLYADSKKDGRRLIDQAFAEAARVETVMEPLKGAGELKRINATHGPAPVEVSDDLRRVLERVRVFHDVTGGLFDPTIAPVKWLWDFEDGGHVPDEDDLERNLELVGFDRVVLGDGTVAFDDPDMKLDLGGVAKGYAVDRMLDVLRDGGASAALVNAGGDIATFGKKPGDEDWVIGVRHPRLSRTYRVGSVGLPTVATSGDYERFFMKDGVRYHHILDPRTGYPARGCISVSVWTVTAMDADILSTSLFILGPEQGIKLAEGLTDVEALIFHEDDDGVHALMTSGLEGKVRL